MIKEPLYYLLYIHFYSSPLSLRDISPQGGERLKVFVCSSSPLSLRDISPQGGERFETSTQI